MLLRNLLVLVRVLLTFQSLRALRTPAARVTVQEDPPPSRPHADFPRSSHSLRDANAVPSAPTRIGTPFRCDVSWSLGWADQGRSGQHRSFDGRRPVQRAWKFASPFSNPYKVGEYGRVNAIRLCEQYLDSTPELIGLVSLVNWQETRVSLLKSSVMPRGNFSSRRMSSCARTHTTGTQLSSDHRTSSELNLLARAQTSAGQRRRAFSRRECPNKGSWLDGCGISVASRSRVHFQRLLRRSGAPFAGTLADREQEVPEHTSVEDKSWRSLRSLSKPRAQRNSSCRSRWGGSKSLLSIRPRWQN